MNTDELKKATKLAKDIVELEGFADDLEKTHRWTGGRWQVTEKTPESRLTLNILKADGEQRRLFDQQTIINKLTLREGTDNIVQIKALTKQYHLLIIAMVSVELKILKKEFREFTGSIE